MSPTVHDTELCAHESGCDALADCQDLCTRHYKQGKKKGNNAPTFKTWKLGKHGMAEEGPGGTRWCVSCSMFVEPRVYNGLAWCPVRNIERARQRNTGWTGEQYDNQLIAQGNRCYLCGKGEPDRGLMADHCHDTMKPRKLLCNKCNTGIGFLNEDPELFLRAAEYVQMHWDSCEIKTLTN